MCNASVAHSNHFSSHLREALNIKINFDNGQFHVNPKKRFDSIMELLAYYHNKPIKVKQKGAQVYLLTPIPVDKALEEPFAKEAEAKKGTPSH